MDSQAQFVDLVRQRLHSRGEPSLIYNNVTSPSIPHAKSRTRDNIPSGIPLFL